MGSGRLAFTSSVCGLDFPLLVFSDLNPSNERSELIEVSVEIAFPEFESLYVHNADVSLDIYPARFCCDVSVLDRGWQLDRYVVFEREAREFQSFYFFTFLLCHSYHKNITRIAHSYCQKITRKSTIE